MTEPCWTYSRFSGPDALHPNVLLKVLALGLHTELCPGFPSRGRSCTLTISLPPEDCSCLLTSLLPSLMLSRSFYIRSGEFSVWNPQWPLAHQALLTYCPLSGHPGLRDLKRPRCFLSRAVAFTVTSSEMFLH